MNRKGMAAIALALLVGSGAYAQFGPWGRPHIALGFAGSIYSNTSQSLGANLSQLHDGNGVFYGPLIEVGMGHFALGGSFAFSFYQEDWSSNQDGSWIVKMMDYDLNLYLQGHLFDYDSIVDPFLEFGGGVAAKNFQDDSQGNNPLSIATYLDLGIGIGLNFGSLGIFAKTNYAFPGSPVQKTVNQYDAMGTLIGTTTYTMPMYDIRQFKFTLGAKFIL
ncbi:MAG TPA: hypothetical protein VMV90_10220 [Rectinemataceae bacterium]|nr:hypothetical protein [Rectinemataceae bacterium]